jgi:hypothetical protein
MLADNRGLSPISHPISHPEENRVNDLSKLIGLRLLFAMPNQIVKLADTLDRLLLADLRPLFINLRNVRFL